MISLIKSTTVHSTIPYDRFQKKEKNRGAVLWSMILMISGKSYSKPWNKHAKHCGRMCSKAYLELLLQCNYDSLKKASRGGGRASFENWMTNCCLLLNNVSFVSCQLVISSLTQSPSVDVWNQHYVDFKHQHWVIVYFSFMEQFVIFPPISNNQKAFFLKTKKLFVRPHDVQK